MGLGQRLVRGHGGVRQARMKIAIVGLGIAGLSAAARLARDGCDVSGFDRYEPMHTNGSSHGDTRIIRLTPGEGDIYVRLAEAAAEGWRAWESTAGAAFVDWTGGVMAGPPGSAFIASCLALAQARGRDVETLTAAQLAMRTHGAIALPADWSAVMQDDCGVVRADDARAFLIAQALAHGAKLHWNTPVNAPVDSLMLHTALGPSRFDAVIIAAGAWAPELTPELTGITIERRVVAWLRPRGPIKTPVLCADGEGGLFGMPTPDGLYKIGLHVVGEAISDPSQVLDPGNADSARLTHAARLLPLLDAMPVSMSRCLYTITPDENFIIRPARAHPRILIMSCCSGHGFKYAPAYGDIAAAWVEERPHEALEAFAGAAPPAAGLGRAG